MCSRLCATCQQIKIEDYFCRDGQPRTVELGLFQDIAKRIQCPLCSLVIKAFNVHAKDFWEDGKYPVEMCYLGKYDKDSNNCHLQVWFDSTSDTFPTHVSGYSTTVAEIIRTSYTHALAHGVIQADTLNYTRLLGEKVDLSLIRRWIGQCILSHGSQCDPPKSQLIGHTGLKLLLVDVQRLTLAEAAWESRYMALSYVWGYSQGLRCTKANIGHLQKDGALRELIDELPRTISDAIYFCQMGYTEDRHQNPGCERKYKASPED